MPIGSHHHLPAVVMHLGVTALVEQAPVVEIGGTTIGPVHEVVDLGM